MPRVIFHVDMDAFFASVEQRDEPAYRGQPVIVGAPPDQRGVVCAASYEARKFQVRSAMPSSTAARLCPHGIFVRPRMEAYRAESAAIMEILRTVAPVIEKVSVDEAYLEVSAAFAPGSFDVVVANPPYRKINSGRINVNREKALARHEITGTIRSFSTAAGYVLKPAGRACFIYPASRMVELLCSLREALIEPKRLRMVYSHQNEAGKFVLVEGVKQGGEELETMPPLFIYEKKGVYGAEMASIFRELASAPGNAAR
jgi:tRNA1(Val) A37 N6-methylase TrmN6